MTQLDWSRCQALEITPGGECVLRGTGLPVRVVFENLAAGMSILEISQIFGVQPEAVAAVLHFVSASLEQEPGARKQVGPNLVRQAVSYLAASFLILGTIRFERTNRSLAIVMMALSALAIANGLLCWLRWKNQQNPPHG